MSRAWAGGSTRAWRETRAIVLARDGGRCTIRLPGTWTSTRGRTQQCRGRADAVHHLHGRGRCVGCRADQLDHLAAACSPCNLRLGEPKPARPKPKAMTRW